MKKIVFYAFAAGLISGAGCTKKTEDAKTQETAIKATEETVKTTEKVEATQKTEEATKPVAAVVSSLTVQAEDVMGDLNQSVEEIKQKVAGFDQNQVMAYAGEYKNVILEKKEQLTGMAEKIKGLSMTEMLGEKGKELKTQLSQYTEQLAGLKDRYGVYLDKLKDFGVDLSAYGQ